MEIIYADPPWNYCATGNSIPSRSKEGQPYNAMRMIDIYDFKLPEINGDCVLFMWGFEYKTIAFTWIKKNKKQTDTNFWGMGSWTRSNPEFCLLAVKGKPKAISHSVHSVIETPIESHSKKPDIIRDKIVELCGDKPRIELFARKQVEGWLSEGNQL